MFENRTGELRFLKEPGAYTGVEMKDGEWLVTVGEGVGISAALLAMAKRLSWNDWLLFSEKCGMPVILGNTGAKEDTSAWKNLLRAISNVAPKTGILADLETRLQAVQIGGSSGQTTYRELIEVVDRGISSLYRGGDLATMSQGTDGVGSDSQDGESELMDADGCAMISETLHRQIDRHVVRFTCGDFEPLAGIVINPPAETEDIDRDIKIDTHLAGLGVKLSKADALSRYGRTEAKDDHDALQPASNAPQNGLQPGFNGLPNEEQNKTPFNQHEKPFKISPDDSDGQGDGSGLQELLGAFSRDLGPAAEEVKKLLADLDAGKDVAEAAKALVEKLPDLMQEDPAMAAVIAEEMARQFGEVASHPSQKSQSSQEPLANEEQPRGKATPDSTPGSFAPTGGASQPESRKAREKREKEERQKKHMDQGVKSMPDVLSGKDVRNFMPGFKNSKISYDHIAFYQGDSESGFIHIRDHAPDIITGELNHQAMLQGNKIPETIARGTWYDDGKGIRVVYNDRLVILGKDGNGLRILSAYEAADKAKSTRSDKRFVRLMNEKEVAI